MGLATLMDCRIRHPRNRCVSCDAARARQRVKLLEKYHARRAVIVQMLGGKCSECSVTVGLEIDHIDQTQKAFYISRCMTISIVKLHEEVRKCRLLCVDHHRKTPSYGRSRRRAAAEIVVEVTTVETEVYVYRQDIEF